MEREDGSNQHPLGGLRSEGGKLNELALLHQNNMPYVLQSQTGVAQYWLRVGCDPAVLIANYAEVNKRLDEIKTQGEALVADYIKLCNARIAAFKE